MNYTPFRITVKNIFSPALCGPACIGVRHASRAFARIPHKISIVFSVGM